MVTNNEKISMKTILAVCFIAGACNQSTLGATCTIDGQANAHVTSCAPLMTPPQAPAVPTNIRETAGDLPGFGDLGHATPAAFEKSLPVVVVVDKEQHRTHVYQLQNETLGEVLCVKNSTGKPKTPTPEGRSVITQKQFDPIWKPPVSIDPQQRVVQPFSKTHKNPLGVANLRLSLDKGLIALHGTNEPKQIGKSVSHGCIRHLNDDILKVAALVRVGTPVYIVPSLQSARLESADFAPVQTAPTKSVSAHTAHTLLNKTVPST